MNYLEYYYMAKSNYKISSSSLWTEDFVNFRFHHYLNQNVDMIAKTVSKFFGSNITGKLSLQYKGDIFNIGLQALANNIVPALEGQLYQCNLFVDKIYIYRNVYTKELASSWLWHYDNNPPTVYKIMIYLTDVKKMNNAPFQYVNMSVRQPSRLGPNQWFPAPNNSRIPESQIDAIDIQTIYGPKGTCFIFNPNVIHRATVPSINNYRDVLILRVRPTIEPVQEYISHNFTTSFEVTGAVPSNPLIKKCG